MIDYSTAAGAYGYMHGATPVGAVAAETQVGADGGIAAPNAFRAGPLSMGTNNPLFWLLLLFLVFTGWVFGGFDFGIKRVGQVKARAGRR